MNIPALNMDRLGRYSVPIIAAISLLASSALALAQAQQLPKVGYLGFGAAVLPTLFQNRMGELGYSEGKNVSVEYRFAEGRAGALPRLARELIDAKVDVIMAVGDEAIVAAKNATRTVPIVMIACDAVTTGFVASLARPGGNLTGVTCVTSELMPKRLAVFRELLPAATKIAILYNPENVSKPPEAAQMVELAKELGLAGIAVGVPHSRRHRARVFRIFKWIARMVSLSLRSSAQWSTPSSWLSFRAESGSRSCIRLAKAFDAGGLISYGPHYPEMVSVATGYVAKILKGQRPAELPVEQPTRFELVVNLKTAEEIGLTIPPALLASADEVIE